MVQNSKLISVIIPAYNIEKYLGICIESVQNQTYENLEIIVVIDGSTDNCKTISESYAKNDSRIHVISKENGGLSDARNVGIDFAKGDYIVLVDGDDYIEEDMIALMYQALVEEDGDMTICNIRVVDHEDKEIIGQVSNAKIRNEVLCQADMYERLSITPNWFYVVAWNKLYKREIFQSIRFPKGKVHEDEFVIHHTIAESDKIVCIDDKLYNYVQRESSITHDTYDIKRMDNVEAFIDRAEFFLNNNNSLWAYRMLKRIRISLIDGYLALKGHESNYDKERIKELYMQYRQIYQRIPKKSRSLKRRLQLTIFNQSFHMGVWTSGNYWHALKYR